MSVFIHKCSSYWNFVCELRNPVEFQVLLLKRKRRGLFDYSNELYFFFFFCTKSSKFMRNVKNEPQQRQKTNVVKILIGNGISFAETAQCIHYISGYFLFIFLKEMNTMTMLMCSAHNRAGQKKSREFWWKQCESESSIAVAKETQYYCVIECNVSIRVLLYGSWFLIYLCIHCTVLDCWHWPSVPFRQFSPVPK